MTSRERIRRLLLANPHQYSLSELARTVGVSKERARQLVLKLGLKHLLYRPARPACAVCGAPVPRQRKYCPACAERIRAARRTVERCAWCGREFALSRAERDRKIRKGQRRFFCSRECRLAWWGEYLVAWHKERKAGPKRNAGPEKKPENRNGE